MFVIKITDVINDFIISSSHQSCEVGTSRGRGFPSGSAVKNPPTMQEMWVQSLGGEDPLEEEMAPHSRILAWRIPRTEEPGGCSPWGFREPDTPERLGRATPQPVTGKASCGAGVPRSQAYWLDWPWQTEKWH